MPGKLFAELPQLGAKPNAEVFHSIFSEPPQNFESKAARDLADWTWAEYVEEMTDQGRAVRYDEQRFNELKRFALNQK